MAIITLATAAAVAPIAAPLLAAREQRKAGKESARLQEEANRVQAAQSSVESARRRRIAIAQNRIAQAQNLALGQEIGINRSSSGISGAQASLATNLGTNLQSLNRSFVSGQQTFDLWQQAQRATERGQRRADAAMLPLSTLQAASSVGQFLGVL